MTRRLSAAFLILSLGGCAHGVQTHPPFAVPEAAMRDVCIPYVAGEIDDAEVGRRLGWRWTRNLPDPFTPPQGPIYRRDDLSLMIIDGRQARNPDGSLTTNPRRNCAIWLKSPERAPLMDAMQRAALTRSDAVLTSIGSSEDTVVVACVAGRVAVRVSRYSNGTTGVGTYSDACDVAPEAN